MQIPVFLGYPLLDYALFITPPRCHLLGPQGIAPDEVAEPVVLDVAHLSRKEVELEHACCEKPLYLRFRYGRNIMKAGAGQRRNLSTLDHAPVPHERHPLAAKTSGHLRNLRSQRSADRAYCQQTPPSTRVRRPRRTTTQSRFVSCPFCRPGYSRTLPRRYTGLPGNCW